jgi:hypothetical protein
VKPAAIQPTPKRRPWLAAVLTALALAGLSELQALKDHTGALGISGSAPAHEQASTPAQAQRAATR